MALLEIQNLVKSFKTIKAVDGISFNVEKGDVLGLLGPNGAGKSTTISMIATLTKQDQGRITYKGKDIKLDPKIIQAELGYVPQEIALYPMLSGRENMYFWGRSYGLRGKTLKEQVEVVSEIIGIKGRLKDKVKTYSGGMKRRLNIGVALLHKPELIIMDEPTVGIDPQSRKHILETVRTLNQQGVTVIYTSHYMEEVAYLCNKVCIMDYGKIIAEGTTDTLVQHLKEEQEIHMKLENINEALLEALKAIPKVRKVEVTGQQVVVHVSKESNIFKELIEMADRYKVHILSIEAKEPDLEAVFLKLTGRALRD